MTDARPQGEPADLGDLPPFPLDTGALALSDRLSARYKAFRQAYDRRDALIRRHRRAYFRREPGTDALVPVIARAHAEADRLAADILAEYHDWLRSLAERARQDTAEGDDFGIYLDTVLMVSGDNNPDITEPALALQLLLRRALSGRKADRAEAQWLADVAEHRQQQSARDGIDRPLPPWLAALADLSRRAKAKGRGIHRDPKQPERDLVLLLRHERKPIAPELAAEGARAPSEDHRTTEKAIARARRARDIAAQALCELRLLSGWNLPHLTPPPACR
jgi:hypothetical protein